MKKDVCGTFEHCSKCEYKPNCCSDFGKIDAPVISTQEKNKLEEISSIDNFCSSCGKGIYNLNLNGDNCVFYNEGCTIYDNRPLDCRLFPFDLKKIDGKYYLVLYRLRCLNEEMFVKNVKDVENIIEEIKPWIESYTDDSICSKLDSIGYRIVKEITINN